MDPITSTLASAVFMTILSDGGSTMATSTITKNSISPDPTVVSEEERQRRITGFKKFIADLPKNDPHAQPEPEFIPDDELTPEQLFERKINYCRHYTPEMLTMSAEELFNLDEANLRKP